MTYRRRGAMRLFLAIPLPDELRAEVARRAEALRSQLPRGTWVRPGAMHLTLRFFGEREPERAAAIEEALRHPVAGVPEFDLRVARVGAFPQRSRPQVIWLGLEESPGLAFLYGRISSTLSGVGEPPENRPFRGHVTLLRCKARFGRADFERIESDLARLTGERIPVREVTLFESHLGPGGARHEALARLPLAAG